MYEEYDSLVMLPDEADQELVRERDEFEIDDASKANWAVEKVIEEQKRFDLYAEAVNAQILDLKTKLADEADRVDGRTSFLRCKLMDYLDSVPAKKSKTQKSLKLPSGTIVQKYESKKLSTKRGDTTSTKINTDDDLIKWCEDNNVDVLKESKSIDWATLKKDLIIDGDNVIYKPTGEICDALDIMREPIKLEVKE